MKNTKKKTTTINLPVTQHPVPITNDHSNIFTKSINYIHDHILYLNNSKFFAGCIMILLNVGSKFISIQFSRSTEEYLKMSITKQILVFAMAWMGTRDIYAALGLTAVFVILSDHLFNEESSFCVVPHDYRILHKLEAAVDANNDHVVTNEEISTAIAILEKAKREKTNIQYNNLKKMQEKEKEEKEKEQKQQAYW
jgi:hypothetical protein